MATAKEPTTRRIKLAQAMGGTVTGPNGEDRGSFVHMAGSEIDWDAQEAARFVQQGKASFVTAPAGNN